MKRIMLGLAGALAVAGALAGAPHTAAAQGYDGARHPGLHGGHAYYRLSRGDDHGDPLHRYYVPGLAPDVGNPSVSPSYMAPHVDDGLIDSNR